MSKKNQNNLMESKLKKRKHQQIIHSFDQSDLNCGELRWTQKKDEQMKCAYFSSHSDTSVFPRK